MLNPTSTSKLFAEPLRSFCLEILESKGDVYDLGPGPVIRYGSLATRLQAVEDFSLRFEQKTIDEISEFRGCTPRATIRRLDKFRDAFVFWLTGGLTTLHRGLAYNKLKDAKWHDEDICAVLRNSINKLRLYAAAATLRREELLRQGSAIDKFPPAEQAQPELEHSM